MSKGKNNVLSLQEIAAADDIRTERLTVPEWGGDVLVRMLDGLDAAQFQEQFSKNQSEAALYMVRQSVVDDNGEKVFKGKDAYSLLRKKSQAAIKRISDFAIELNGMDPSGKRAADKIRKAAESEEDPDLRTRLRDIADELEEGDEGED